MVIKVGHFKFHLKDECLLRSVEAIEGDCGSLIYSIYAQWQRGYQKPINSRLIDIPVRL